MKKLILVGMILSSMSVFADNGSNGGGGNIFGGGFQSDIIQDVNLDNGSNGGGGNSP